MFSMVENKFGVLARISGMFSGQFNIETLNVALCLIFHFRE